MKKILIIEDAKNIRMALEDDLTFEGYKVETASTGPEGLEKALELDLDIILLDLMLPELNGLEICKELRRRSKGYFEFKEGTLYPALHRMEKEGLVRGEWQVVEEGPSRKYYHLTDKGREELARSRQEWATFADQLLALLGRPGSETAQS